MRVPAFAHFSLNCSSLSVGTPVKVNPTQDSLFSKKRGLIWAKHTWTTHSAHCTGPRASPQQLHTALAPGPALNSCTLHWPQGRPSTAAHCTGPRAGPHQLHTALAPGPALNSCTLHWPQGRPSTAAHCTGPRASPQQLHTALALGPALNSCTLHQISLTLEQKGAATSTKLFCNGATEVSHK